MAAGDDTNKGKEGKGFAGLSSLMSEIDTPQSPVTKKEPPSATSAAPGVALPAWPSEQPTPPPSRPPSYQAPAPSSSDSSAGKWLLGIAAVIGWLWVMGESNKKPAPPAPTYAPSAQAPAFTTPSPTVSAPEQAPSRPVETKPPVGQDLVFSVAQIRYCLAEDIRMEGAKSVLNYYSDSDVDGFNAMVSDYNSRCRTFRYQRGALERASQDVERYRSDLSADGRSRFARRSTSGAMSTPAQPRPIPDATVQIIQSKLNELGYDAGETDGIMGRGTRSAILEYQRDMGLTPNGRADGELLAILNSATRSDSTPPSNVASSERQVPLSSPPASIARRPLPTPPSSASRDKENFKICVSGQYPSLCKHALLTPAEATQVAAAEQRENLKTCVSGNYPSLCKRSLLTVEQIAQVAEAERRVNLKTCLSGNYPSLCNQSLLTSDEESEVAAAERHANFQTCVTGRYPSLCKHAWLTAEQSSQVATAERRVNLQTCMSGQYPSLCKRSLLTSVESESVAEAERRSGYR